MKKLLIAMFLALVVPACAKADPEKAEAAAREFAQNYPDFSGNVACTKADTDGDGYVTCTAFMKNGDEKRLECGAERFCIFNCARGCKPVESLKLGAGRLK